MAGGARPRSCSLKIDGSASNPIDVRSPVFARSQGPGLALTSLEGGPVRPVRPGALERSEPIGLLEPWGSTILLVEDNPGDAKLVERMLRRAPDDFHVHHVRRLDEAIDALTSQEFSVVLLDLSLPDGLGLENVSEITEADPRAPIVVLTGLEDQAVALEALKAGAQDFLTKGLIDDRGLLRSMRYAIERKRSETRLAYLAHHDQLTGLANRVRFRERLSRALVRAERSEQAVAVLFLDLDRFKQINDTLGHEVGDQLLVQVAERLRRAVRSFETVARLGGDEFVVVLEDIVGPQPAEVVARRILTAMEPPFRLGAADRRVSTSIGVAVSESGEALDRLLERADEAMYRAKRAGRNTYAISAPGGEPGILSAEEVERALDNNELELLYQPKLDLGSNRVAGVEGLLRWHHPKRGELAPQDLLPLLESTGLMVAVGDWVLRRACLQARRWTAGGHAPFRLAVNVAQAQFDQEGLTSTVADVLLETGFPAERLELEVTEEVLLRNVERSREVLSNLRRLGVRIALDDFNARSSLTDLAQFPLDIIKLDRSLVSNIAEAPAQRAIVAAVVNLAKNLGVETVAEGVETVVEQASLRQLGCTGVQGFLVCGPMDAVSLTVWLASYEAEH